MATPSSPPAPKALIDALYAEHVGECHQNECDINMAHQQGAFFYAAQLLTGATETPRLDAVLAGIPGWRSMANAEFSGFAAWFRRNTTVCPGCGGYVQKSVRAQSCDNCRAPIRAFPGYTGR